MLRRVPLFIQRLLISQCLCCSCRVVNVVVVVVPSDHSGQPACDSLSINTVRKFLEG